MSTRSLLPSDARSFLELGSGDGRLLDGLDRLRPWPAPPIAADRSIAALRRNRWCAIGTAIDATAVRDRAVDCVLCCEVLEHLPRPAFEAAVSEIGRLAGRYAVITVPNRENRQRAEVRCRECGCRYNPMRHLRSFAPADLTDLLPGFRVVRTVEAGPRHPVYPRVLRTSLERVGILHRSGAPSCPQCGEAYGRQTASTDASAPPGGTASGRRLLRSTSPAVRRLVPRSRHRYWLGALYERTGVPTQQ